MQCCTPVLGHWIFSVATSYGYGTAFLVELLAVEFGLKHGHELGSAPINVPTW